VGYGPGYGGGPLVPPPPPRPERPLMPGVWWSLAYNAIVTVLWALAFVLLGALIWTMVTGVSGQDSSWQDVFGESGGAVVAIAIGSFVVALLVQWGLTVVCLVLWRLVRGFRTLHPALQALLALLTSWVVGTILSFVLQIFGVFANVLQTGTTSF
jgi:magnesium-transporting ATPase (P-type)